MGNYLGQGFIIVNMHINWLFFVFSPPIVLLNQDQETDEKLLMEADSRGLQASTSRCDARWSQELSGLPPKLLQRLMPFQREGVEFALSRNGRWADRSESPPYTARFMDTLIFWVIFFWNVNVKGYLDLKKKKRSSLS